MQATLKANSILSSSIGLSRLTVFAFLWGNIRVFHQLSFPNWLEGRDPRDWGLFLLGLLVMAFPGWMPGLLMLLAVSLAHTIAWMPFNPNHILFEFLSDLAILGGLLYAITQRGLWGSITKPLAYEDAESVFDTVAPAARFNILFLYFYAVLHKLNWDYLNVDNGCGTQLLQGEIDYWLPGYALPYIGKVFATYGSLMAEAAIPMLFLFRKTRPWGVLLGLIFHFTLSLHPHGGIFSFTGLIYSYFFLFLSPRFTLRLGEVLNRKFNVFRSDTRSEAIANTILWGVFLASLFIYGFLKEDQGSFEFGIGGKPQITLGTRFPAIFMGTFWMFLGWCLWMLYLFFAAKGLQQEEEQPQTRWFIPKPILLILPGILIIINGLSPYLGLKTHTSFSMFSNIRTEGRVNNHVFMPRAVSPWQDDLVTIVASNAKGISQYIYPGLQLTYFEFRHAASTQKGDFYVDYIRNGQPLHYEKKDKQVMGDPELNKRHSYLARKLLRFRPVYPRPCPCQH